MPTEKINLLFEQWARLYQEDLSKPVSWLLPAGKSWYQGTIPNQPSLRRALFEGDMTIATFPSEYNCRIDFPGFIHARVKIIHGRADSFKRISKKLNHSELPRVHMMRWGRLMILDSAMPAWEGILARTRWSLHQRGVLQTAKTTMENILRLCGNFLSKLSRS